MATAIIHMVLYTSGLVERWLEAGLRWVFFFQDTNAMVTKVAAATLGASLEKGFVMNSVAVPRRPKDAMGGIARFSRADGSGYTINVEYNELDPLLRNTTTYPEGDVADASGYSPFPGNMNSLVLALKPYVETLTRTSGIIAEFVNPKYADETDLFEANCRILRMAGPGRVEIEPPRKAVFNGIEVDLEARVVWSPQWAQSFEAVQSRLAPGAQVSISQRSTLILDGDVTLVRLQLDGALVIRAAPGCRVRIESLKVANEGWELEPVTDEEEDEVARIRGFRVSRAATRELVFDTAGEHVVAEEE